MVRFGDIDIPWITDKSTSISKDIVEKNFVDNPPQVYELTPDLESGTYTAILNEDYHERSETLQEQQDAVLSMNDRHGSEFPFSVGGDEGFILVESSSVNILPTHQIREVDIDIRFFDDDKYRTAIKAIPDNSGDFNVDQETVIAIPSDVNILNREADYTLDASDGQLSYYLITGRDVIEYEDSIPEYESRSICRIYDEENDRVYSDRSALKNGSSFSNNLVEITFQEQQTDISAFLGSAWEDVGSVLHGVENGYAEENTNDKVDLNFIDYSIGFLRGFHSLTYTFSNNIFEFEPESLFTEEFIGDFYSHYNDGEGRDIVIVRSEDNGDFFTGEDTIGIENISGEMQITLAIVPDQFSVSDYANFIYNVGTHQRSFTQK